MIFLLVAILLLSCAAAAGAKARTCAREIRALASQPAPSEQVQHPQCNHCDTEDHPEHGCAGAAAGWNGCMLPAGERVPRVKSAPASPLPVGVVWQSIGTAPEDGQSSEYKRGWSAGWEAAGGLTPEESEALQAILDRPAKAPNWLRKAVHEKVAAPEQPTLPTEEVSIIARLSSSPAVDAPSPRKAVMLRLVGNARCNQCKTHKPANTAFDVAADGSCAVLVCDDCLRAALPPQPTREAASLRAVAEAVRDAYRDVMLGSRPGPLDLDAIIATALRDATRGGGRT